MEDWVFPSNFTEQPSDFLVSEVQSHTVQIYVSKNILLRWNVVRLKAETKFLYSLESTSVLLCALCCDSILIRVENNDSRCIFTQIITTTFVVFQFCWGFYKRGISVLCVMCLQLKQSNYHFLCGSLDYSYKNKVKIPFFK